MGQTIAAEVVGPFCIFVADEVQFAFLQLQRWGFVYDVVLYFGSCRDDYFVLFWVEYQGMGAFAGDCHLTVISVLEHHLFFMDFA